MDINIYEYINTATQRYYGDVSPTKEQELWGAFCETIPTPTKEYLAVISSKDKTEVRAAVADFVQGAIAALVAEGEIPPEHASAEVQKLIDTLAEKLVAYRDQPELDGLISTNKQVVYATLVSLCSDLDLTQALTSLLTRAAATIAERGAALPTLYLDFLAHMVQAAQTSEATVALSPREDEIRRIMFEIFNLALEMVRILQRSSILQGNLLYHYSKVQREYTDMMTKTQLYGPTPNYGIIADSADFGNTSFGYGNVTMRNVVDNLMQQMSTSTGAATRTFEGYSYIYMTRSPFDNNELLTEPAWLQVPWPFKIILSRSGDGGYKLEIQGLQSVTVSAAYTVTSSSYRTFLSTQRISADHNNYGAQNPADSTYFYYPNENLSETEQPADVANKLLYHLTNQWNETPNSYNGGASNLIQYSFSLAGILLSFTKGTISNLGSLKAAWSPAATLGEGWERLGKLGISGPIYASEGEIKPTPGDANDEEKKKIDEANAKARQEAASFRSEANSLLQIYMENSRALKDAAKEASKRSESVLTQLKEAMQNQSNFLSAITECLRGMLSAIFR